MADYFLSCSLLGCKMLRPGLPRLDSGGRGGTRGSLGTVMFCSFADLRVIIDVGGGWGLVGLLVRRPLVFVRDWRNLEDVLSLGGAELFLAMGPGFSGCVGLGTSWPLMRRIFLGWEELVSFPAEVVGAAVEVEGEELVSFPVAISVVMVDSGMSMWR